MRTLGIVALVIGGIIVLSAFNFDVGSPGAPQIANLDRMNQRTMLMIFGLAVAGAGLYMTVSTRHDPPPAPKPPSVPPAPPVPPPGFGGILGDPFKYRPNPVGKPPSISFPMWRKNLEDYVARNKGQVPSLYLRDYQLEWGWKSDLDPKTFLDAVVYIEIVRRQPTFRSY